MRHSADLSSNDESALPRELGSNRPRPRALQQDQQVAIDWLGIDHVRVPDAASFVVEHDRGHDLRPSVATG
jgi:hypothetical protein